MTTRAFTDDEVRLLDAILLGHRRYRDRAFLWVSLGTGFRVSETLGLDWSQVITPAGEISRSVTIERAHLKGGAGLRRKAVRSRRVPLNERVRAAIADYLVSLQAVPQGPVFRSRVGNGKPITRMQAFRLVKGLAHEAGLDAERVGCHSARKTFASQIYRAAKYDLLKAQRILGHSSPLVTARYLDTDRDELDTLVLGLGQATVQVVATGMALTGTSDRTAEGYVTHSL